MYAMANILEIFDIRALPKYAIENGQTLSRVKMQLILITQQSFAYGKYLDFWLLLTHMKLQ